MKASTDDFVAAIAATRRTVTEDTVAACGGHAHQFKRY